MTPLTTLTVHNAQTLQNMFRYRTNRLKPQTDIKRSWRWRWFWCWICDILAEQWWTNTGNIGYCWRYTDNSEHCWHILTTPGTGDNILTIFAVSDRILATPGNGDYTGKIKLSCLFELPRHKAIQCNAVPWFVFIQNNHASTIYILYITCKLTALTGCRSTFHFTDISTFKAHKCHYVWAERYNTHLRWAA